MAWIFSADMVEFQSHCQTGCDLLHTAKSRNIVKGSCYPAWMTDQSRGHRSATTSNRSPGRICQYHPISYTGASLARTSVLQELEEAWGVSEAAFFTRSCAYPKKSDPDSYSLKTSPASGQRPSIPLSGNWPISGMTVDGVLYPLRPLERLTKGKGGSSLPDRKNWPTPTVRDSANKPMPPRRPHPGGGQKPPLLSVVNEPQNQTWPTPTARGYRDSGAPAEFTRVTPELTGAALLAANNVVKRGKLNPPWVEWLMGLPSGWTELRVWVTGWFHSRSR